MICSCSALESSMVEMFGKRKFYNGVSSNGAYPQLAILNYFDGNMMITHWISSDFQSNLYKIEFIMHDVATALLSTPGRHFWQLPCASWSLNSPRRQGVQNEAPATAVASKLSFGGSMGLPKPSKTEVLNASGPKSSKHI